MNSWRGLLHDVAECALSVPIIGARLCVLGGVGIVSVEGLDACCLGGAGLLSKMSF